MALKDILQKIEDEADQKAKLMKKTVDDEIKKTRAEGEAKATARRDEIAQKAINRSVSIVERAKVLAKMESRSALLKEKRDVINSAYSGALKELTGLNDADYTTLLTKMIKSASAKMPTGHLTVPASRKAVTEQAITKAGSEYSVTHESNDIKGGFIVRSNKVEMDLSFEALLNNAVRPKTELEVVSTLFN